MTLVVPSPKVHAYPVMLPVEVLVKFTVSGAKPDVEDALNFATGALDATVRATSFEKPLSLSVASYAVTAK